jgi:hypothetical protein
MFKWKLSDVRYSRATGDARELRACVAIHAHYAFPMLKSLVLFSLSLICMSCSPASRPSEDATSGREPAAALSVQPLDSSLQNYYRYSSGYSDSARLVIRTSEEWARVWARMVSNHGPTPTTPTIDFSREVVIVAAMGTRATGGYTIAVTSVSEDAAGLVATVVSTSPGRTCGTTAALTAPVDIVRVNRLNVPVRFVEQQSVHDCG